MIAELRGVLARPRFERWASHGRSDAYASALANGSEEHPDPSERPAVTRDPNDDYLVALARSADADVLVSLDRDLLDIALDDLPSEHPAAFLERLDH